MGVYRNSWLSAMAGVELTPEQNLRLLEEMDANRAFILLAYQSDPALLELADPEIKRLFDPVDAAPGADSE
jgi:hypothetical protein